MCQSTKVSISNKTQNTDLNVVGVLDNVRHTRNVVRPNGRGKKHVIITVPSLLIIVSTIEICRIS